MNSSFFLSIAATGFMVAFVHAALPTHWLPLVLAGRGQGWSQGKTLAVTGLAGIGHTLFTTFLGVLVVWLGIETSRWTGGVFPYIAGGILVAFGLYYLVRQAKGGHGHHHVFGGHDHAHAKEHGHGHRHDHDDAHLHPHEQDHPHGNSHVGSHSGARQGEARPIRKSDAAVIIGLLALLTFSPCEGFLPVYLSGIQYGWVGFVLLSAILALATVAGMLGFTWLTFAGIKRFELSALERYESGILGAVLCILGIAVIVFE